MSAHDATEAATYATEPSYAPVNVVAYDEEREARAERRDHLEDEHPYDLASHPPGCRCPDHGDWLGAS